jgi:hypothetical protein
MNKRLKGIGIASHAVNKRPPSGRTAAGLICDGRGVCRALATFSQWPKAAYRICAPVGAGGDTLNHGAAIGSIG